MIKGDGDDFVREADRRTPQMRQAGSDLGLDDDPIYINQKLPPASPAVPLRGTPTVPLVNSPLAAPSVEASTPAGTSSKQPLRTLKPSIFSKRQKTLLLVLSVVAAVLIISTLISSFGPGPENIGNQRPLLASSDQGTNPSSGDPNGSAADNSAAGNSSTSSPDVINLIFLNELNTHHYLQHPEGQILVLIGRIRNGYSERISHIRVKAQLKNSQGQVIAERQVFAGNYLEENELTTLSMKEILARLALRGGTDGSNLNIQPGQDVPFMFVFDKLPPDITEYVIEPISYTQASQALSNLGNQSRPSGQ
jgi:hypothetical protein